MKTELILKLIETKGFVEKYRVLVDGMHWFGADYDRAMLAKYEKEAELIEEQIRLL